jgi:hypothetical protein
MVKRKSNQGSVRELPEEDKQSKRKKGSGWTQHAAATPKCTHLAPEVRFESEPINERNVLETYLTGSGRFDRKRSKTLRKSERLRVRNRHSSTWRQTTDDCLQSKGGRANRIDIEHGQEVFEAARGAGEEQVHLVDHRPKTKQIVGQTINFEWIRVFGVF